MNQVWKIIIKFVVETRNVICDKFATEISSRSATYKRALNNLQLFLKRIMMNAEMYITFIKAI